MDWDVDMDDVADGFAPLEAGVTRHLDSADTAASGEADRSVDSTILVSTKVHIRGLNSLTTDSIKSYVRDHYGPAERVEWIDDESANLVFSCESSAQEALKSLSAIEIADVTQLPLLESVPAKALASHPEVKLQIRFSVLSDKKAPGAAQRSRFYLLHPEFDPEERRRRNDPRSRYRERAEESRHCLHERIRHTRERSPENYHAGMYDDDESTSTQRVVGSLRSRRRSRSRPSVSHDERNRTKELFPLGVHASSRSRNRSASPMREDDGDANLGLRATRAGTVSNRQRAAGIRNRLIRDNESKELFPHKEATGGSSHMDRVMDSAEEATRFMQSTMSVGPDRREKFDLSDNRGRENVSTGFSIKGVAGTNVKELLPSRFSGNTGKELFTDSRARRRQKAEDSFS